MAEEDVREDEFKHTQESGADDGLDNEAERLRSWYEDRLGNTSEREETIGLLGGRSKDRSAGISRSARRKRVWQMFSIVRKYDVLHGLTPTSFRRMLEELGPTFVKAGQILSMRSEILPESFCRELAKLRSDVEPMSHDEVLETLRAEYDVPIEEIFDAIDDVPLGSASVAQVHKAKLVSGELVAVKLQRPNVRSIMAQDIGIMRSIAKHASRFMRDEQVLDIKSVVEELWQSFQEETDFLVEARALYEFRQNNARYSYVTCPKPYPRLCTEHVVVMDYIEGISIAHTKELMEAGYDLEEIGEKLVDNYAGQMLDDGFFHADPHPGNILVSDGKIVYIDLGMMGRLSAHDRNALSDIVFAVGDMDTPRLMDGLLRFSVSADPSSIGHAHLLADLDTIVQEYGTASLSDLNLSQLLNAIIALAQRNDIILPSSVTMLARSLVTLEGTVDDLLSNKSIVDVVAHHIRSKTSVLDAAQFETKMYTREMRLASHGLLRAISQASLAMNMLTRGQLRVNMDIPGTDDPISDFSHTFDRLTMGIVIAGLFIGSSIIYFAGMKPLMFGIPIIGFLGFVIAFILGIWLFVDILRETFRRRR